MYRTTGHRNRNCISLKYKYLVPVSVTLRKSVFYPHSVCIFFGYAYYTLDGGCHVNKKMSLYIHVTVHRNRFIFKQPTRCTSYPNLFCYKTLHVSGIFSAHHHGFSTVHSVYDDRFQAESGCSWLCLEAVIINCMKLNSAECTVENSWWWAEKMPETCRVL